MKKYTKNSFKKKSDGMNCDGLEAFTDYVLKDYIQTNEGVEIQVDFRLEDSINTALKHCDDLDNLSIDFDLLAKKFVTIRGSCKFLVDIDAVMITKMNDMCFKSEGIISEEGTIDSVTFEANEEENDEYLASLLEKDLKTLEPILADFYNDNLDRVIDLVVNLCTLKLKKERTYEYEI